MKRFLAGLVDAAHPRVSGENMRMAGICRGSKGSSPRERGKLIDGLQRREKTRLIPA